MLFATTFFGFAGCFFTSAVLFVQHFLGHPAQSCLAEANKLRQQMNNKV